MLDFINNQTAQYEAYTDRYLCFKVEYRKLVPLYKPKATIVLNGSAIEALNKLFTAAMRLAKAMQEAFQNKKFERLNYAPGGYTGTDKNTEWVYNEGKYREYVNNKPNGIDHNLPTNQIFSNTQNQA